MAGGAGLRQERQTCLFQAVIPMHIPMLPPRLEEGQPRMIPYKLKWEDRSTQYVGSI